MLAGKNYWLNSHVDTVIRDTRVHTKTKHVDRVFESYRLLGETAPVIVLKYSGHDMWFGLVLGQYLWQLSTLESGIDVGQGINLGPGKIARKNKRRALNKCRASEF